MLDVALASVHRVLDLGPVIPSKNGWSRARVLLEAYVRHLNRSELPPSHPRVQRAVLRSLRLTERHLQRPSALEWLEPLGEDGGIRVKE